MNAITPVFGRAAGGISFDAALGRVLSLVTEILGDEEVALMDCTERVIASPFMRAATFPGLISRPWTATLSVATA